MSPSFPRFDYRVLTTFLIVGLPALAVAAFVALGTGQAGLRQSYGEHLAAVAEQSAATIDAYVYRRIVDASILTRVPQVRAVAAEGNKTRPEGAQIQQLDREWQNTGAVPAALAGVLTNPASTFLAGVVKDDPVYRELLLTDLSGRLVAASNVTSDYYQADEEWWTESFGDGVRGRVSVGDVVYDQSARVYALEIALPVTSANEGQLAGILKVIADIREIATVIDGVRLGATGDAVLLRENGTLVFSRRPRSSDARFFAADLLREQFDAARRDDFGYHVFFSARAPDGGDHLVAVAPSQLSASYPHLTWLVAVSRAESELFAPIRAQAVSLLLVLALTAIAVLVLALWFSMRLSAPPPESEIHLVEHAAVRGGSIGAHT